MLFCSLLNLLSGHWPGFKKTHQKPTVPWAKSKQAKEDKKERRKKRKAEKKLKAENNVPLKKRKKGKFFI